MNLRQACRKLSGVFCSPKPNTYLGGSHGKVEKVLILGCTALRTMFSLQVRAEGSVAHCWLSFVCRYRAGPQCLAHNLKTSFRDLFMTRTSLFIAAAAIVGVSGAASAQSNSEPGADRYNSNPGRQQAFTQDPPGCNGSLIGAGAGAFGFYGKDSPGGFPKAGDVEDGQEHANNVSSLCGENDLPN